MILPTKNTNLDESPLIAGATIIELLSKGNVTVSKLLIKMKKDFPEHYYIVTMRAINMLYIYGKIEYDQTTDSLGLLK
ncbi:MAG: hypothetical protein JNL74_02160 [Fibrobacteres bacterium]|nr:hypothetical protein [Fibrobacterota bacterium]